MSEADAYLAGIRIYPIKSLDPVSLTETALLPSGALAHDREFALRDAEGRYVNAKRHAHIHKLRMDWEPEHGAVCLRPNGAGRSYSFSLTHDLEALEGWLSRFFDQRVTLDRNPDAGFPDDTNAPGPTVISTATLETVASWYPGLSVGEIRTRFRANLEIGGVPAFWEDRLYGAAGESVSFSIGDARLEGVNPCQRCIVPTRDIHTSGLYPDFAQTFRAKREETLPPWANRSRFNHFYRLAVNTYLPPSEQGKALRVGDSVTLSRMVK